MLPSTVAFAPTITPLPSVGWRLPPCLPVMPRVTPWYNRQSSPMTAVPPMTTPTPWSMVRRRPIVAAGWMSAESRRRVRFARRSASLCMPCCHSQWFARYDHTMCVPVEKITMSESDSAAGSRASAARASSRIWARRDGPFSPRRLAAGTLATAAVAASCIRGPSRGSARRCRAGSPRWSCRRSAGGWPARLRRRRPRRS